MERRGTSEPIRQTCFLLSLTPAAEQAAGLKTRLDHGLDPGDTARHGESSGDAGCCARRGADAPWRGLSELDNMRELSRCIAIAKGLEVGDKVLCREIIYRLVRALLLQARRGAIISPGMAKVIRTVKATAAP